LPGFWDGGKLLRRGVHRSRTGDTASLSAGPAIG
jgi:hypothetical protein